MTTTLINPLFIFSNVVYIRPEKKYILIRRETWNTVVRIVFPGCRPSNQDLRKLKEVFYNGYKSWMDSNGRSIDFKKWNGDLAKLQVRDRKVNVPDSVINYQQFKDQPTIKFEEETFFDDDYIDKDLKNHHLDITEDQKKLFINYNDKAEESKQDINTLINLFISISPVHKGLVEFIGYGRLLNLSCQLRADVKLKGLADELILFFRTNPTFLYASLTFRNISVFFICERCRTVNQHQRRFREKVEDFNREHDTRNIIWFVKDISLLDTKVTFNDTEKVYDYNVLDVLEQYDIYYRFRSIGYGLDKEILQPCSFKMIVDIVKLYHLVFVHKSFFDRLNAELRFITESHHQERHYLNRLEFYLNILETDVYKKFFRFHICNVFCNENNCSLLCNFVLDLDNVEINTFNQAYFVMYGTDQQKQIASQYTNGIVTAFSNSNVSYDLI